MPWSGPSRKLVLLSDHSLQAYCRQLKSLATENSLPETELVDSAIPLRMAKLQREDEQEFLESAAMLDLRRENIDNATGYLMQLLTNIAKGQRRPPAVNRCKPA